MTRFLLRASRGRTIGLGLVLLGNSGCDTAIPALPTAPASVTRTVSLTMWVHGPAGVEPAHGRSVVALLESGGGWVPQDPVTLDANGRHQFTVVGTMRVLFSTPSQFLPCPVTVEPGGDVTTDLHVVEDIAQLGAHLPAPLRATSPTLSGRVYERVGEDRVPVPNARVILGDVDSFDGPRLASTLTDETGRYVLCGVPQTPRLWVSADKAGYRQAPDTTLIGGHELDMELVRR